MALNSVLKSLIRRHVGIIHLEKQHISMVLTQGIREVLLSETFSEPVSSMHLFEKTEEQHTRSATEAVCNLYIDNIIKDISGAGILFAPSLQFTNATRAQGLLIGGYFADSVTDLRELKAFARVYIPWGIHCLERCISAVIAGNEFVRVEREYQQRQSLSNGHAGETVDPEMQSRSSAEASIKATMKLLVKFSAGIILDSWSEANRSHLVAQLIFLDQLCEISPYLPRSSLEPHALCSILCSIYSQYITHSISTTRITKQLTQPFPFCIYPIFMHLLLHDISGRGDSTPQNDSGYCKGSFHGQEHSSYDGGSSPSTESRQQNFCCSRPLDYTVQAVKLNLWKAKVKGALVLVHCRDLPSQSRVQ